MNISIGLAIASLCMSLIALVMSCLALFVAMNRKAGQEHTKEVLRKTRVSAEAGESQSDNALEAHQELPPPAAVNHGKEAEDDDMVGHDMQGLQKPNAHPFMSQALSKASTWAGDFMKKLKEKKVSLGAYVPNPERDISELGVSPFWDAVDDVNAVAEWRAYNLIRLLNSLAIVQSELAQRHFRGAEACGPLAEEVLEIIYDELGTASEKEGWFVLERIVPFKTPFNPDRHCSVGVQSFDGHAGQIAMVRRVGLRGLNASFERTQAEVVVAQ